MGRKMEEVCLSLGGKRVEGASVQGNAVVARGEMRKAD